MYQFAFMEKRSEYISYDTALCFNNCFGLAYRAYLFKRLKNNNIKFWRIIL